MWVIVAAGAGALVCVVVVLVGGGLRKSGTVDSVNERPVAMFSDIEVGDPVRGTLRHRYVRVGPPTEGVCRRERRVRIGM